MMIKEREESMSSAGPDEFQSIGSFTPPEADRVIGSLVAKGVEPEIEVDDGIRNVNLHYGSCGVMAQVTVYVDPKSYEIACKIRNEELDLTDEA